MFLLTNSDYEVSTVKGVFTSVKKAQKYVTKVMHGENLNWSTPNLKGSIWVDYCGCTLTIEPVAVNPTA